MPDFNPTGDLTVQAKIHFLTRSPVYDTIKPYTLRYRPDDGFPQTNVERELCDVVIRDLRRKEALNYASDGFVVVKMKEGGIGVGERRYEDFTDENEEWVQGVYGREVGEVVRRALGATEVQVLDFVIRRRDAQWPIATGEAYASQQPASAAHIDHTYEEGRRIIRDIYREKADAVLGGRWQCVNAWHPLRGPLTDWPLALCSAPTVDFASDTMAGDVIDRDAVFENTQVHFNQKQEWWYLPNQMPDELLVFKNADSEENDGGGSPGVPHASFDNLLRREGDLRRESIEFRLLVRW